MLFYFIQELFFCIFNAQLCYAQQYRQYCRKKQHHQQINHQVHFLSRIQLYLCTLVCRQILYLRQQAKVNTPNTAKLKQALKVAAVIYLHLSLHNHIIPLPQRQVNARNRKNSPDQHKKAVNITRAINDLFSINYPRLTGLLFCSLTDYSIIKLIKAKGILP